MAVTKKAFNRKLEVMRVGTRKWKLFARMYDLYVYIYVYMYVCIFVCMYVCTIFEFEFAPTLKYRNLVIFSSILKK